MLNYVDKFYLFCKKFSIFISVAFLIVFFGCLFAPTVNVGVRELKIYSIPARVEQLKIIVGILENQAVRFIRAAVYHSLLTAFLLAAVLVDVSCLIFKKRTYYVLPIVIIVSSVLDVFYSLMILHTTDTSLIRPPSTAFYLTLAFLLLQVGFNVFMRMRHRYYLAHDGEPTYPPRKPRAVKPPKPHKPTQRERIDELQREIEELKKRDA